MKIFELIGLFFIITISLTLVSGLSIDERADLLECKSECRQVQKDSIISCNTEMSLCKTACNNYSCLNGCAKEKSLCSRNVTSKYRLCQKECIPVKNVTKPVCVFENVTYDKDTNFTKGCEICTCKDKGKVSCVKDNFCNLNVTVSKDDCVMTGGFYGKLCAGPYFDLVCTPKDYCLCGGLNNSTCPADYTCLKKFVAPLNRRDSVVGWKTSLGKTLGDIGVCGR